MVAFRKYFCVVVGMVLMALSSPDIVAQDQILVMGKVISSVDDEPMSGVKIYVFKTVGAGQAEYQRALETYETFYQPDGAFVDYRTMPDGTFDFNAQPNGSILFYQFPFKPVFVKIRGMNKIPTVKIQATTVLDASNLIEKGKKKTKKGKPVALGNHYAKTEYYYFDQERLGEVDGIGKENARLVAQMYLTNSDGSDTLQYFPPRVYDGEHFHQTQYHWRKDYLYDIADKSPRLQNDIDSIQMHVSFDVDDPTALYYCKANIWIEDYIKVYYRDSVEVFNTGRVSRPFQFLEYTFDQYKVDPKHEQYFKPPRREDVSAQKNMKLQFLVDQAELDRSDAATMASLDSLKAELTAIFEDPAARLNELHFEGLSSPDGRYEKNKSLSDRRTQTVFNEIWKIVPQSRRDMIFKTVKGRVATWGEVADLMESRGYKSEAEQIRKIEASNRDMDEQGKQIRRLPFYKSIVMPILPELRSVKCNHVSQVYRFLEPHEILERYNTDEGYRNGTKVLTLNEYWNLFNLIKDEKELEKLYERARVAAIRAEGKNNPWALPSNHLAIMKLKRKQCDTTLLRPFINERWGVNFTLTQMSGDKKFINDQAIVANQVQMFMLAKNYSRAEELSSIIEYTHPELRAVVRCLGGFLDYEDPAEEAQIELIRKSSPRNGLLINLYLAKFDSTTVQYLKQLPDEPLSDYLKAQRLCLQYDGDVMRMKATDFDRSEDPSFLHPKDEIVEAATPEEIEAVKADIERIKGDIEIDVLTFGQATEYSQKQLDEAQAALEKMEKGEKSIIMASCTVYEAAYLYLKKCFERNPKMVKTAQADYDITEALLNDVLGIKKEKK